MIDIVSYCARSHLVPVFTKGMQMMLMQPMGFGIAPSYQTGLKKRPKRLNMGM